jgi:hypothetical protein
MNMQLNGKTKAIASTAIATTAIAAATFGVLALIRKKRASDQQESTHARDMDLRSNIGPGEINPYADTPTDPANQN